MEPGRARTSGLGVLLLLLARWFGWFAPVRPTHGVVVLTCGSAALRVHVCAVSWGTWLLLPSVPARCVVLRVRCPGPLGSYLPLRPLRAFLCLCGVLGHLAPVPRCARSVCCGACAVSWDTWLLFTGVQAWFVVLLVRCPGTLDCCSPVCLNGVLCCVCGVLGHLAPVHRCACLVCCVACPVSWATWLLLTGLHAWFVELLVRCPWPLNPCSPVCPRGVLCCVCGVLAHLAPVHRCARWVRCFACTVFFGHLAPVHWCTRSVRCVACAVSWATWLLFTSVPAQCVVSCVRCPWPLCSYSPLRLLCASLCLCGVLGHLGPVHQCARSVCCGACAVSWATGLLLNGVHAWFVALLVRCPGTLGSCSPVCLLGVLCCVCGVLGPLAPVHRCA